ncbi:MAG: DUF262 domain-containing protein [Lachnospiraceae bacterium]|nr:DUF262 domain-containing protein [Lachnospiraceae bacterium]
MESRYQPPIRTGLLDFFRNSSGCQFVIPVYQRNYTWTAGKEVRQYLDDMKSVLQGEYDNHFLGIMIYMDKPIDFSARELSVIDGQQRLTTTFLTLYAIKELFRLQGQAEQINNLEGQYLTNPFSTAKMKYKLKPLVSDDEVYKCIVEERMDDIADQESNVYKNYFFILDYIKELVETGHTLNDILFAMNKLYVVCVPISENDNAQKIFESINATGVKLTASDLIRNFILMDLQSDIQEEYYAKYWKKIEDYISSDARKLELFFRMFLAVKNMSLPNKNVVYRLFVKWFKESAKETKDILEEIVSYAEAYHFIYKKNPNEIDGTIRPFLKEFRRILTDMPAPALMEFFLIYRRGGITAKAFAGIIEVISSYVIRRSLCNYDTSSITRLFPTFLKDVLTDCDGDYSNIVEVVKKDLIVKNAGNSMNMPDDGQMKELIQNANMYNLRSTLRIVFDRMELENNSEPVDLSMLSVEHLMPQTPTKEWFEALDVDEETYQKNLHRLGNLTLASKKDNSIMGNKPWSYKNEVLKGTSHLKLNEKLLRIEHWNIDEIDKRTYELIDRIIQLYPYPKISKEIIPREEIFIDINGVAAKGFLSLDDGSVEVDIGSQLAKPENIDKYPEIEEIRQDLLDDEIIAEVDGKLQFVKPYVFYSKYAKATAMSTVANILMLGRRSGWNCWTDASGVSVKDKPVLKERFPYGTTLEKE